MSSVRDSLIAAASALVVALLNEQRARSAAREARIEREAHEERLRQIALNPDRRAPRSAPTAGSEDPPTPGA